MRDTFFPSGKSFPTEKHQISPLHISKIGSNLDAFSYISLLRCIPGNNNIMHEQHRTNQTAAIYSFGRRYDSNSLRLAELPYRFEAGTPNLSGIIGFSESINYLNEIGMDNIERHEKYLKKYLIKELEKIPYIKIYNKDTEGSIVLINIDGVLSGDLGLYLNTKGICVRSGKHCAKMGDNTEDTVRISLYFYNTYEEIDYLIKV